jgi:hypothetical protein
VNIVGKLLIQGEGLNIAVKIVDTWIIGRRKMETKLNETDKQIYEQLKRLNKNWPQLDLPNAEKWKKDRLKANRELLKILKGKKK